MRNARYFGSLFCIAALLGYARPASAKNVTGRITGVIVSDATNLFIFKIDTYASLPGTPACNTPGDATHGTNRYAMSLAPTNAKAVLASVMLAYAMGTPVTVMGTDRCDVWGNAETASYVCLGDVPC